MCHTNLTTFPAPSDEESVFLPDTFSFPSEVTGPTPEPEPMELTGVCQVEEELPPSSARDRAKMLEELQDTLPVPAEEGPPASGVSPGEALRLMRDKHRRPSDRTTLHNIYLNTISGVLRARNCRFSQGNEGGNDFFVVSDLGAEHRRFDFTIDLFHRTGMIQLTIRLPFFCGAEMLPTAARYLTTLPSSAPYSWRYDQQRQRFLACQTIPYWDPTFGEDTVEHLLDDAIRQVEQSFDVLQWLCTGLFSRPPEESTLTVCRQLLKELEEPDEGARQRALTRLHLSLDLFP